MAIKVEKLQEILSQLLFDLGFELVEVSWFHAQGRWILRLKVDKEAGVIFADCVRISKEVGTHLDETDVIEVPYTLAVSSPGLGRPLRSKRDFEKFVGQTVSVHTAAPVEGRSNWKGILQEVEGTSIKLLVDGVLYNIPLDAIGRAALVP